MKLPSPNAEFGSLGDKAAVHNMFTKIQDSYLIVKLPINAKSLRFVCNIRWHVLPNHDFKIRLGKNASAHLKCEKFYEILK